jgi:hypothetical protein
LEGCIKKRKGGSWGTYPEKKKTFADLENSSVSGSQEVEGLDHSVTSTSQGMKRKREGFRGIHELLSNCLT